MGKSLNGRELGKGISQRKDGSYTARYVDKHGVRRSLSASTINDIRQKLKVAKFDEENRVITESKITLSKWFDKWLDVYKNNAVRIGTKAGYILVFEKHIKPFLGYYELNEIKTSDVRRLINKLDMREGES